MMSLSSFIGGARLPIAEEIDACVRQDHQAKMHSDPDRDNFFVNREIQFYFVQRVDISKLIFIYLQEQEL